MALFEAKKLTRSFDDGTRVIEVLKGADLSIEPGEMCSIVGASGSGKTTFLQLCGTLARPSGGELHFDGKDLLAMNEKQLAAFRNSELGFIFQFHHLLPEFTTLENVMMPGLIAGRRKPVLLERAKELLAEVELSHRQDNKVGTLSGGEQQRTALARALLQRPRLLLADEPTGNLDSRAGTVVFALLKKLCSEFNMSVIMVTHNMELAHQMDSIRTLHDGMLK